MVGRAKGRVIIPTKGGGHEVVRERFVSVNCFESGGTDTAGHVDRNPLRGVLAMNDDLLYLIAMTTSAAGILLILLADGNEFHFTSSFLIYCSIFFTGWRIGQRAVCKKLGIKNPFS